jgi:hypothetical protein
MNIRHAALLPLLILLPDPAGAQAQDKSLLGDLMKNAVRVVLGGGFSNPKQAAYADASLSQTAVDKDIRPLRSGGGHGINAQLSCKADKTAMADC